MYDHTIDEVSSYKHGRWPPQPEIVPGPVTSVRAADYNENPGHPLCIYGETLSVSGSQMMTAHSNDLIIEAIHLGNVMFDETEEIPGFAGAGRAALQKVIIV